MTNVWESIWALDLDGYCLSMPFDHENEIHFDFVDQDDFLDQLSSQRWPEFPYEIHFWNFHLSMKISDPKAFEFHEEQEYKTNYFSVLNVAKKKKVESVRQVVCLMKDDCRVELIDCFGD